MSETIYFKQDKNDRNVYKAEWTEDFDYESPREDRDNLGTMVFIKNRNGSFGDEQVEDWGQFFLRELQKFPLNGIELDKLTDSQLYERWKDAKAAVLPINLYIHSGETCHEASVRKTLNASNDRDDGFIYNDGFIYVDKDNEEFLNELKGEARDSDGKIYNTWKPKTEEDAKKWAEENIRAEIREYANYLEGDVHTLTVSWFNPKTLGWEKQDDISGILGSSPFVEISSLGYSAGTIIEEQEIKILENSINPEFKAETAKLYIEEVKENLQDFDGNIKAAATSVSKVWKATKSDIHRAALNEYFKDNKLDSPEKTFNFLSEKAGIAEKEKQISPINIKDENIKAYIATIKNPNRSDNGGLAKLLLVDEKNKSFAYFNSPSYIIQKGDIFGKVTNLGSGKRVEDKAKELSRYGFKDVNVSNESIVKYQKHFSEKDLNQDYQRER